jgi:hypothetical protein
MKTTTVQIYRQFHRPGYSTFDVLDTHASPGTAGVNPVLMSGLSGHGDAVRWAEDHSYIVDHRYSDGSDWSDGSDVALWCGGGAWRSIYAPTTLTPRPVAIFFVKAPNRIGR